MLHRDLSGDLAVELSILVGQAIEPLDTLVLDLTLPYVPHTESNVHTGESNTYGLRGHIVESA